MSDSFTKMVHYLILTNVIEHPLPWRIEQDWTHEVTAADGHVIAKFPSPELAQQLIDEAKRLDAEMPSEEELFRLMDGSK